MMVVGYYFVCKDLYFRTEFQHALLLMDECPPNRSLLHHGLVAIVRKCAKQGLPTVGHHRDMYDAWLAPHTGFQPGEGFALW